MDYNVENLTKKISKSKKRKNIINNFAYVILIIYLVINVILIIQTTITPKKVPSIFGYKTFSIVSESMEPVINVNDLVITKKCKQQDVKQGDIISYKKGDVVITHRVDKVVNEKGYIYYLTKGDNNFILDEHEVKFKDIEGKYVCKVPYVGKVVVFLKNEKVVFFIILLLVVWYIANNKKNKKKILRSEARRKYEKENLKSGTEKISNF